jgi:serine/threonine protein kinase
VTDANVAYAGDAASAALADDTILGKYKIVRRLSAGGMAEVFLAKQVGIGGFEKPVALKRILRQLLEQRHLAVDMFLNEAKIAGRLMHPNIVQVLDVGQVGGALYLAMEYVHGKDLRDVLKRLHAERTTMPLGDACYIVGQVAQALHHAYWSTDLQGQQLAVIHRDVSPHNVILGYDGTVKLLDFGVAMSAVTEHAETLIAGKWAYMSPEHTTNQQIDHRSDLFSVGVMLYLLCTGKMPFSGNDPREIVKKIRSGSYKPLKQACPDIPENVSQLVGRLLSPTPDERPRTGLEVVTALNDFTRSYGIESSGTRITALLSQLFANDPPDVRELVRTSQPSIEIDATRKLAAGSQPFQGASPMEDKSPSPSGHPRFTPTGPFGGATDQSVSLARRSTSSIHPPIKTTDVVAVPPPPAHVISDARAPKLPSVTGSSTKFFWIVVLIVLLAGALATLYFVVKPQ